MSYPSNPREPKYNIDGRYLTEYINSSNFFIYLKLIKNRICQLEMKAQPN